MVDNGPNERSVGIKSRLVAEYLEFLSNLPGAQPVSVPLAAERVGSCHLRSTAPLRNGRGRPARTHPSEQPRVLRQFHVARRYGSAHASAGRASALGHFWRLPKVAQGAASSASCYWGVVVECKLIYPATPADLKPRIANTI